MKDLFLITAYTPDIQRKEILRKFVKSIDKKVFDIMVVSHSSIPLDVIDNIDYFIYDSKNPLLTDIEHKYSMFYTMNNFQIVSTENRPFNHALAALKLVTLGLSTARNEGYTKVHCIEYDSEIESDSEFIENSQLLDKNSLVYYKTDYSPYLISFPVSFNLNTINEKWFQFNLEELKEWVKNDPFKTIESYEMSLLENETPYNKSNKDLSENGVIINTFYSGGEDTWVTPIINPNNELLLFICNRPSNLPVEDIDLYNVKVIVNNTNYYNWDVPLNTWKLDSLGNFDDIKYLVILRNGERIINYNFTQIDKEAYKKYNFLTHLNG